MTSRRLSRRNPRATRACARCRKRKIRCDFAYPRCGTCAAVAADCMGFDSTTGQEQPRSLVTFLENKVARLEIELAALNEHTQGSQDFIDDHPFPEQREQLRQALTLINGTDRRYDAAYNSVLWRSTPYISSSLLPTLRLARTPEDAMCIRNGTQSQKRDIASIPRHVVDIMLRHYADVYLVQYPILDESELMERCDRVYSRTATSFDSYVVCMALSISAHTLIRHDQSRATKAADEFWETATIVLDSVLEQDSFTQLQAMMLLCHYSFVNPSLVNSSVCSRAAITLCLQLGLHREPPPENIRGRIDLDTQRRIFWTCYALDAQNQMLMGNQFGLTGANISVQYPSPGNEGLGRDLKVATANYLYNWRQLETEITTEMLHPDSVEPGGVAPEWLEDAQTRARSWREVLDSCQFAPKIEFRDLMFQFQRLRLNRISPRSPKPTFDMRRECIAASTFMVADYCRILRQGNLFYWHHCCWHLFEIGLVLVEATHTGLDLISLDQESFLTPKDAVDMTGAMRSISFILRRMLHRWPQVERMALELDELFSYALVRLDKWSDGKVLPAANISEMASIRQYLLCEATRVQDKAPRLSLHPGGHNLPSSQLSAIQTGESLTMEEVFQVLQPVTSPAETYTTPGTRASVTGTTVTNPLDFWSPHSTLDSGNPHVHFDIDSPWLPSTEGSSFWQGVGLELDDIFTAFNEGNC